MSVPTPLGVGVVGCGLIGSRRAKVAASDARSRVVAVTDVAEPSAAALAGQVGAEVVRDWKNVVARDDVDVVVVATPNAYLAEITIAALDAGKHVLVEKPMGRTLAEAQRMLAAANRANRMLKVGFNHRYHPAIADARRRVAAGEIGDVINLRCRYGHGGRPGSETEWRGSRELAGGGELLDQGVHALDLFYWFAGVPTDVFAVLQTAVWQRSGLEDNAFGLFRYNGGVIAALHASMTQWKNLFSFEVFGCSGAVVVEGLGGSYGVETLSVFRRRPEGGVPLSEQVAFDGPDPSWQREWSELVSAIIEGTPVMGQGTDGLVVMRMVEAMYQASARGSPVPV